MNKRKRIGIAALLAVLAASGYWGYRAYREYEANGGYVIVSGNIELTDADLSFKMPGRVASRHVDEGEAVTEGQIVAELDKAELEIEVARNAGQVAAAEAQLRELERGARPQEIEAADAALRMAEARLNELEAGARPQELMAAEADVLSARAESDRLEKDHKRIEELYERAVASGQQRDAARSASDIARQRLKAAEEKLSMLREGPRKETIDLARAAMRQAQQQYDMVLEGPRQETVDHARAQLEMAQAALAQAQTALENATLRSPMDGVVLSENIEAGEFVSPGTPVITVGDLEHVWLRGYVNESDLGRVKLGQPASVTTDSYPEKTYEGVISFIASEAEFTPKSVQTAEERVKLVYRIKIDIENPNAELKPGMPADAVIQTN